MGWLRLLAALAGKDLRRRLADPAALLLNLAIPLAIAGTMALAFGNRSGSGSDAAGPKLRLILVDLDGTPISGLVAGAGQNPEASRFMEIRRAASREEGLALLREEEYPAMLVLPKGTSAAVAGGRPVELEVVKNPAQTAMPIAAQQMAEVLALYASGAARLLGDQAPVLADLLDGAGWDDTLALTSLVVTLRDRVRGLDDLLLPPLIEVHRQKASGGTSGGFNFLSWMYPGMVVMGLLFVGQLQMRDLLRERDAGTLRRQLAAPVSAGSLLLARMISVSCVVAVSMALLMLVGSIAFGLSWGRPGPLLAAGLLLVLAVTGFSALIFALVKTERQGDAIGGIVTMLMALLGGTFIPSQVLPEWAGRVALFTVNHWGHEALRGLAAGRGLADIAGYLAVLAGIAAASTLAGALLLKRRHVRGAT